MFLFLLLVSASEKVCFLSLFSHIAAVQNHSAFVKSIVCFHPYSFPVRQFNTRQWFLHLGVRKKLRKGENSSELLILGFGHFSWRQFSVSYLIWTSMFWGWQINLCTKIQGLDSRCLRGSLFFSFLILGWGIIELFD
jgi:hypothetical protein